MSKERRTKLEEPTIASMGYNTESRGKEEGRKRNREQKPGNDSGES